VGISPKIFRYFYLIQEHLKLPEVWNSKDPNWSKTHNRHINPNQRKVILQPALKKKQALYFQFLTVKHFQVRNYSV